MRLKQLENVQIEDEGAVGGGRAVRCLRSYCNCYDFSQSALWFTVGAERMIVLHMARQPASEQGRAYLFPELKLFQE